MVAIVHLTRKLREVYRHERHCLDTFLTHTFKEAVPHLPASHIIVYQSYLDTLTRLVYQGIAEESAKRIVGNDIHTDMYMALGLPYVSQQGGKKLIAIGADIHLIIFKRQCQALVHEKIDQWLVLIG